MAKDPFPCHILPCHALVMHVGAFSSNEPRVAPKEPLICSFSAQRGQNCRDWLRIGSLSMANTRTKINSPGETQTLFPAAPSEPPKARKASLHRYQNVQRCPRRAISRAKGALERTPTRPPPGKRDEWPDQHREPMSRRFDAPTSSKPESISLNTLRFIAAPCRWQPNRFPVARHNSPAGRTRRFPDHAPSRRRAWDCTPSCRP